MKRLAILIIAVLLAGCVTPFTSSEGSYQNRLYWVANEAPSGSAFIMFADVNKLSANPVVIDKMGVPAEMAAFGLAVKSLRAIAISDMRDGPETMIVEGAFDLSGIIPIVTQRISQAGGEKSVEETYGGYVIKSTGGPSYFTKDNRVYLAEPSNLKKIIDVKNGGANAVNDFEGILSRLPDGDFLMASQKMDEGEDSPEKMGISATVEGNIAHTTFIGKFADAAAAQAMKGKAKEELGGEGVEIKSVTVDGAYVIVVADMDLTKSAGPFGEMGAPPNPEHEGMEIRECMDSAHWECEEMNWECQDLVDDKCKELSWECEDQMHECYDPYEWDDRMRECVDDYYYEDLMRDCWPEDWEDRMDDCYDNEYYDAKQRGCWEECEDIKYDVDCSDIWEEYNSKAEAECNDIREEYNAKAEAECDELAEKSVHVNETTNETYYTDYDCSDIWNEYDSQANSDCNEVWDDYNAKGNSECDELNKGFDRKVEDCNDDARACSKRWDEEAQDKWRECERKINEEIESSGRDCQEKIEDEWTQKRRECEREIQDDLEHKQRECERNIDKSCWDEVNRCYEEAMQECQPKIDECYDRKYEECAGEAGVKGYEHAKPVPVRTVTTERVRKVSDYDETYSEPTEEEKPAENYGPPGI
ncbi:MAG: hypothetical protein KAW41_01255 [Candidatus Diapherotrites archaeon]|nr:hypothetical protein [Candidatus Diapherotrites archaeon]